jgi:hypothetical protein
MGVHGRSFLLGLGLFGMVVGACFGLVVGKLDRECAQARTTSFAEGATRTAVTLDAMCDRLTGLRMASFGLVAMSALGAILPALQARFLRRAAG